MSKIVRESANPALKHWANEKRTLAKWDSAEYVSVIGKVGT